MAIHTAGTSSTRQRYQRSSRVETSTPAARNGGTSRPFTPPLTEASESTLFSRCSPRKTRPIVAIPSESPRSRPEIGLKSAPAMPATTTASGEREQGRQPQAARGADAVRDARVAREVGVCVRADRDEERVAEGELARRADEQRQPDRRYAPPHRRRRPSAPRRARARAEEAPRRPRSPPRGRPLLPRVERRRARRAQTRCSSLVPKSPAGRMRSTISITA